MVKNCLQTEFSEGDPPRPPASLGVDTPQTPTVILDPALKRGELGTPRR